MGFALVLVIADILFVRSMDEDKSFLPVIEKIKEVRDGSQLVGFDMSEMERGVFPFYLEQNVPNLLSVSELSTFLDQNKDKSILLLANRNKAKDIDPVLKDRMELIYTFRPDKKTRSYLLYQKR
jgi:hypothetical protein